MSTKAQKRIKREPANRGSLHDRFLALLALMALSVGVEAAELTGIEWQGEGESPALLVKLDGDAAQSTEVLDEGRRLRLTLEGTSLGANAVDITGSGMVKGAFPYLSDNGENVHIDLLLREPGKLDVAADGSNYVVTVSAAEMMPAATATAAADMAGSESMPAAAGGLNIEEVLFSPLPGGRVQITLRMNGRPEAPGSFSTATPPRIALDFFNTGISLDRTMIPVRSGPVDSIAVLGTEERTRVVLNLMNSASFESEIQSDGIVLVVSDAISPIASSARKEPETFSVAPEEDTGHSISKIDFRRSQEGGGKIIVEMSDSTAGIDVREESGEIIIDFIDTDLPAELERRLDVIDFATPVQTIDTFSKSGNVRMVVTPIGRYQQLAYQSENIFTLQIVPLREGEEEKVVDEFGYSGEKLSLNFQKISVRAALQVIADFTGLNFVTSDSVRGTLTLRLQDVPWDQALDIILQTRGLAMRQKGNVVWVAPAKEIAAKERQALEANKQVSELEPLVSELIEINYAKASDIATLLRSVKSVDTGIQPSLFGGTAVSNIETVSNSLLSPRGQVTVDKRTNTILIQDTAGKITEIRKLISQLDKPVRQVMVETRIVEAADDYSRALGARLGFQRITENAKFPGDSDSNLGTAISSGSIEGTGALAETLVGNEAIENDDFDFGEDGLNVNLPVAGIGEAAAGQFALSLFKAGSGFANLISLELTALEAEGKGKIIANPRLVTANQKQARIEQGQERIFTTNVLGVGSVVTKKAVLSLTVTPQITPDDSVILDVRITKDTFVGTLNPNINTKQVTTQVLMENGETVVIGGIYEQTIGENVSKVPVLGDIPVLGWLFKKKEIVDNRTELLVFLTPRIISPELSIN